MRRYYVPVLLLLAFALTMAGCDSLGAGEEEPPPNQPPSVSFSYSPADPSAGTAVSFTASASDPDGQIEEYSWDFDGDGNQDASGSSPSHTFSEEGNYTVSLTVTDDQGGTDSATETISVSLRYTQATITSVVLLDMPFAQPNGSAWDATSGPDVYVGLFDGNDDQVYSGSTKNNIGPDDLPISWGMSYTAYNLDEPFGLGFADEDTFTANEYIGGVSFTISDYQDDYPPSFVLRTSEGLEVEVRVEWAE